MTGVSRREWAAINRDVQDLESELARPLELDDPKATHPILPGLPPVEFHPQCPGDERQGARRQRADTGAARMRIGRGGEGAGRGRRQRPECGCEAVIARGVERVEEDLPRRLSAPACRQHRLHRPQEQTLLLPQIVHAQRLGDFIARDEIASYKISRRDVGEDDLVMVPGVGRAEVVRHEEGCALLPELRVILTAVRLVQAVRGVALVSQPFRFSVPRASCGAQRTDDPIAVEAVPPLPVHMPAHGHGEVARRAAPRDCTREKLQSKRMPGREAP